MIDTPEIGAQAACWFWTKNNINPKADVLDITGVTRIVNGGLTNLETRQEYTNIELNVLKNE